MAKLTYATAARLSVPPDRHRHLLDQIVADGGEYMPVALDYLGGNHPQVKQSLLAFCTAEVVGALERIFQNKSEMPAFVGIGVMKVKNMAKLTYATAARLSVPPDRYQHLLDQIVAGGELKRISKKKSETPAFVGIGVVKVENMAKLTYATAARLGVPPDRHRHLLDRIVAAAGEYVEIPLTDLGGDHPQIKQSRLLSAARRHGIRISSTSRVPGVLYARLLEDEGTL